MNKILLLFVTAYLFADMSFSIDESLYKDVEKKADKNFEKVIEGQRNAVKRTLKNLIGNSTPDSTGNISLVNVEAKFVSGFIMAKNLQMSPADPDAYIGEFKPSFAHARSGYISRGVNGIAGYYNYSVQSDNDKILCTGRIYISGKKKNFLLNLYTNCKDGGSIEY